jgi:hypothetical protein
MLNILSNSSPNLVFWLILLHCVIGLSAGIIADTKGYSFPVWLFIGEIGGTVALIASIALKSKFIIK